MTSLTKVYGLTGQSYWWPDFDFVDSRFADEMRRSVVPICQGHVAGMVNNAFSAYFLFHNKVCSWTKLLSQSASLYIWGFSSHRCRDLEVRGFISPCGRNLRRDIVFPICEQEKKIPKLVNVQYLPPTASVGCGISISRSRLKWKRNNRGE